MKTAEELFTKYAQTVNFELAVKEPNLIKALAEHNAEIISKIKADKKANQKEKINDAYDRGYMDGYDKALTEVLDILQTSASEGGTSS